VDGAVVISALIVVAPKQKQNNAESVPERRERILSRCYALRLFSAGVI